MTIKAIIRNGNIQPLEPLPSNWTDGQELVVEQPESTDAEADVREWARELDAATEKIPAEEHERFLAAISEIERESKEAVRREWGLP